MELNEKMKSARENYGISALKMSKILGFGVNQWRLYEEGIAPNASNLMLILLAINPFYFQNILFVLPENIKRDIGYEKYYLIHKRINDIIDEINTFAELHKSFLVNEMYNQPVELT